MGAQPKTLEGAWTPQAPGHTPSSTDLVGNNFSLCYQCGLCTGSCRTAYAMKYTPRQVMNLLQLGQVKEAVASGAGLLCTACYSCTFRCPRGVAVTDMMGVIQRLSLAEKHADSHIRRWYQAFMDTVERRGRFHETEFLVRYYAPNPLRLHEQVSVGLTLLRKGKIALRPPKMRSQKAIAAMFRKAAEIEGRP
jgi:heterodisulfide reductase subunit C2